MINCKALGCGELIENEAAYCNDHNAEISQKTQIQRQGEAIALKSCGPSQKYKRIISVSDAVCIKCGNQSEILHYLFGRIGQGFSLDYLLPYCHACHALAHE